MATSEDIYHPEWLEVSRLVYVPLIRHFQLTTRAARERPGIAATAHGQCGH